VKSVESQRTYRRNTSPPSLGLKNKLSEKSTWTSRCLSTDYTALHYPKR
jgi:hypothetical protein